MDRREFLKIIPAGAALAILPSAVLGAVRVPETVYELVEWFERTFECNVGAPWAFVESRAEQFADKVDDPIWWLQMAADESRDYSGLTPYHTYRVEAHRIKPAVQAIFGLISGFVVEYPLVKGTPMYWRYHDHFRVSKEPRIEGGVLVLTDEQFTDSGYDDSLVEGCECDENGNYWKDRIHYQAFVLKTRIAIPAMQKIGIQSSQSYLDTGGWGSTKMKIKGEVEA